MDLEEYLEKLLKKLSEKYDIYNPYIMDGEEYPAYGYRLQHKEASELYEHVLVLTAEKISEEDVLHAEKILREYMEPQLVRKGNRLPGKGHGYSFLTILFISHYPPEKKVVKQVKKFIFEKAYRFNTRGFTTGRMALACVEEKRAISNRVAGGWEKLLEETFH